jgi:two-component system osmolarity sensor histidine kinase EnvZ
MFSGLALRLPARLRLPLPREPWLRRIMPRSLFGRSLLIILLPLLILQAVLAYIFYERHWDTVTRWLAVGLAGEVGLLVDLLEDAQGWNQQTEVLGLAREHFGFAISLEPEGQLAAAVAPQAAPGAVADPAQSFLDGETRLDRTLRQTFERELERPFVIDTRLSETPRRIAIYVQMDNGLLRVLAARKRVDSTTTTVFMGWMIGLSLLLLVLAIYFLTRQIRPIRRLAWAADNFGKGRDVGDFKLEGATEIRQAGAAFNLMRKRILRYINQRTEMLAAVSHDLRTPLTRMKLELEMLKGAKVAPTDLEELRSDVEEMSGVIEGYLAFARGEGQEQIEPTDLGQLLSEVADRSANGHAEIAVELEGRIELPLRPVAFRRCMTNLIDNAVRHAEHVVIRATMQRQQVWIAVDDDGPGIPAERRTEVFRPFHRLDPSRNLSTGGVGLGLTIARDIVLAHGGDIELQDSSAGGLRVLIRLPR